MKLIDLYNELKTKECYKKFKEEHTDAFLTAGFFILNTNEKEGDSFQIDFFLPQENKMASCEYPFNEFKVHKDEITNQEEITNFDLKVDIPDLQEAVEKETDKKYAKIIAILQKDTWNLTCLEGMDLKRLKINAYSGDASGAENIKLTDIIKIKKGNKEQQ